MSGAADVALIARREVRERVRQRSFAIGTAVTALVLAGLAVVPSFFDDGPSTYDVAAVGASAGDVAAALAASPGDEEVRVREVADEAEGRRLVEDGELDAVVVDGQRVVVEEELGDGLGALVQRATQLASARRALLDAGLDDEAARALAAPPSLEVDALDPVDEDQRTRGGLVFAGVFVLYGQLLGYGFWVASGMVEEKTSRVVEVLLAKVPPSRLLAGKVVGIGLVGFGQLLVLVAVGLVAVTAAGTVDLPSGLAGATLSILGWFALGYAFTSCMFAVAGALASRMEELQSTAGVLNLVMVASFLLAAIGAGDPDGTALRIGSFLPPSAPLCMPLRMANGAAEPWEVLLSIGVVLAATALLVPVAGRVYRGGALETRRQVRLRQAWRGAGG